jgi:hypothetical protein
MTRFLAGDDPIPATVFGTRSKPSGTLGLLIRGVAWHSFAVLVPRC